MPRVSANGQQKAPRARQGFYSRALAEAERVDLQEAAGMEGLDDEVAVVRALLRRLIEGRPEEVKLQLEAVNTIARLLHIRYQLTAEQKNMLKQALVRVFTEAVVQVGIKFLPGPPR